MTYDLRRLRLHGLIARIPNSNTYVLTPQGLRVALFYTKVHDRLLTPLLGAHQHRRPLVFCVTCGVTCRCRRSATQAVVS
jgi:hypothetical protein